MEDDEIETWTLRMSFDALLCARAFIRECEERGLDEYHEAQFCLTAVNTPEDLQLWRQVWEYIQVRMCAGWNDRILFELEFNKQTRKEENMVVIPKFRMSNTQALKLDEMARFEGVSFEEMLRLAVEREYADFLKIEEAMRAETKLPSGPSPDDEIPF